MASVLSLGEAEQLARAGAAALQAGRAAEARASFERIAASGRANLQIWLLLSYACRQAGDMAAAEQAADEVLARDKRNLRALLVKGDARHAAGDVRAAGDFYNTALKLAAQQGELPPDLAAELARAEAVAKELAGGFRARVEARLAAEGFGAGERSARFEEAIAILAEEKQVYLQQPTAFYFPRLPQIQFFERESFDWVEEIEAATGEMIAELEGVLKEDGLFRPYLQSRSDRPGYDFHGLFDNPAWSTLYLWENGGPVERNVARCPKTFAAMSQVPLSRISVRAPTILFSLLKPGARIAPHNGMINCRLICHLPLIVPPGCGFRVGNEVREWEVGKLLIFDDTIEHEAWNDSDEDRVILLFDVWRPELTMDERRAVSIMFEAIDADPA
jgi:aspartyl/asparaginyl beta-hydroxylase (cupin superfamily)